MDEPFVKTTGESQKLSGIQKAAILLGELGLDPGQDIISKLELTPQEMHKLRNAMKALGPYPRNIKDIKREQSVLAESLRFGELHGIYKPNPKINPQQQFIQQQQNGVSKILQENPEAITNLIRTWLDS